MAKRSYYRNTPIPPPELRIPLEGFLSGIFAGVAIETGINADPLAILQETIERTMQAFEAIHPKSDYSGYLFLFGILFFFAAVFGIIEIITQIKDWRIGALLYIGGFVFGFILIILVY